MKKFLTSALAVFTYLPCKLLNVVDTHPTGSQIRAHVARQKVHVTETAEGVAAHLCLDGAEHLVMTTSDVGGVGIKADKDARALRAGYRMGVEHGARLMATEVASVTRKTIRAQTKVLRAEADERAAVEAQTAKSAVGMPPFTSAEAGA